MTCTVCGRPLDAPPARAAVVGAPPSQPALAGAPLHASCFVTSLPGDLLAVATTVAAMVLAPMIVVWGS